MTTFIHPTAIISESATIGENVKIGAFTIIHENVQLGNNSVVETFCELGITNKFCDGSYILRSINFWR
jgi:acyl-[acyl carrier protein]--UDP-N-acetylglucosamine O-acyltransferase